MQMHLMYGLEGIFLPLPYDGLSVVTEFHHFGFHYFSSVSPLTNLFIIFFPTSYDLA